jgi:predicted alpha/beta-hydrolase family hydrolase
MVRTIRISWAEGEQVTAKLVMPQEGAPLGVLLAHGAGAGQTHPFMVTMRDGLAAAGLGVLTFDYAYTAAGRKAPDRVDRLLAVHRAAADRLAERCDRVVLAGKSMGGRVGSHLVGDEAWPAAALVYLGYPLVPLGKGEPRSTEHLERISVPQLFVAGRRDRLSPPPLVEEVAAGLPHADTVFIAHGDHSLAVPKRSGLDPDAVLQTVAGLVAGWIQATVTTAEEGSAPS